MSFKGAHERFRATLEVLQIVSKSQVAYLISMLPANCSVVVPTWWCIPHQSSVTLTGVPNVNVSLFLYHNVKT